MKVSHLAQHTAASIVLGALATITVMDVLPTQSWHDQQRIAQILIITLVSFLLACSALKAAPSARPLSPASQSLLAGILLLGAVSCSFSHHPLWAFTELSLFTGCVALTMASRNLRERFGLKFDKALFAVLIFVVSSILVKFIASYIAGIVFKAPIMPDALLDGFSNLRFLGQFQTLSLPLIALPFLLPTTSKKQQALAMLLLALWWLAALTSGTRATLLGAMSAMFVLFWLGPQARKWIRSQAMAMAIAVPAWILFMRILPEMRGNPLLAANNLISTTTSGRGEIWAYALGMITERPWLGFGPMHFADVTLFYVAHPHQAILQWASEWGLPSLFLVMLLLARPAIAILRTTHAKRTSTTYENALRICLLAALIGAAADAMVDGVIVMPYTQTWVAIMAGWIWSLQPPAPSDSPARKHWSRRLTILSLAVILPAAGLLVHVTLRDYRQLEIMNHPDAPMRPGKGADPPRFWEHGSIAEPTAKSSARIKTSSGKNPYSKQESS